MNRKYNIKLPPNTLTNADGTPYSAGHDDKSAGQVAYEAYYKALGLSPELWTVEPPSIQQVWQEVAEAVIKDEHSCLT